MKKIIQNNMIQIIHRTNNKASIKFLLIVINILLWNNIKKKELLRNFLLSNMKICICTLGKNENKYISEFVEHYKKYGVDKIIMI